MAGKWTNWVGNQSFKYASFHNLTLLVNKFDLQLYEPLSGIEPETFALREQRSTN